MSWPACLSIKCSYLITSQCYLLVHLYVCFVHLYVNVYQSVYLLCLLFQPFSFRHLIPLILFCHCPLSMSFCPSELLLFIVMCLLRFPFYSVRAITFHYIVCIYFLFLTTLPISTYVCLFIFPSQRWVIDKWCHFEIELDIRLAGKELINKRSISLLLTWTL